MCRCDLCLGFIPEGTPTTSITDNIQLKLCEKCKSIKLSVAM